VMLHSLDVALHLLLGNAQLAEKIRQDAVPAGDLLGNALSLRRQHQTPVLLIEDKPLGIEALNHIGDTGLRDPQTGRYVNHPRITLCLDEFLDSLQIVLGGR